MAPLSLHLITEGSDFKFAMTLHVVETRAPRSTAQQRLAKEIRTDLDTGFVNTVAESGTDMGLDLDVVVS